MLVNKLNDIGVEFELETLYIKEKPLFFSNKLWIFSILYEFIKLLRGLV